MGENTKSLMHSTQLFNVSLQALQIEISFKTVIHVPISMQ